MGKRWPVLVLQPVKPRACVDRLPGFGPFRVFYGIGWPAAQLLLAAVYVYLAFALLRVH